MDKKKSSSLSGVKEIARRANVSIATVDRVIHNRKGVSQETKDKINEIIKEIGFQPNILASRLASKKTNRFLVIIPQSAENEYWEACNKGIDRSYAEIKQYGISVDKRFYDLDNKQSFVKLVDSTSIVPYDGVLLAPSFFDEGVRLASRCKENNIPLVFVNSDIPGEDSLSYIGPDLYKSGRQAASLINFGIQKGKVLIVNISKEIDTYHHLLRKEDGFRAYFNDLPSKQPALIKLDIRDTREEIIEKMVDECLQQHPNIEAVFVTNSRVRVIARYFEKQHIDKILVGYDVIKDNVHYLKQGVIDFLIGQKPEEQGYRGLTSLFQHTVIGTNIPKYCFMPIDIITKENVEFYRN
ncbi:substrate-binding domain-containing protein [Olivibacter ginsenosidimutans]|uniref:Substrate-binding domain-containing protein n=1 Tax=Olivibacter ginsenosidimutans TaxID=1176537 RepID=A0ABP9AUT1_9SPHI